VWDSKRPVKYIAVGSSPAQSFFFYIGTYARILVFSKIFTYFERGASDERRGPSTAYQPFSSGE
jgi:hypothetical protein